MKKRGVIKNIVGLLLTGLIVFAGITIPSALLDWQVQSIVGGITNVTVNERGPVGVSVTYKPQGETDTSDATPTPVTDLDSLSSQMTVDELYAHISVWYMDGYKTFREPFEDELSMERIVEKTKTAIGQLIKTDMLPQASWSDYRLINAQLQANIVPLSSGELKKIVGGIPVPSNIGRWTLNLKSNMDHAKMTMICDAMTGTIYEIKLTDMPIDFNVEHMLKSLISYYDLEDDGYIAASVIQNNQISSDHFIITCEIKDSSDYNISIMLKN